VLAPDWQLRGYADVPAALVNRRTGETVALSATGSYVARSCDGASDFSSPFFLPGHVATLDLMLVRGMAVECRRGAALDLRQRLRVAPNRYIGLLNWFVTGRCNERCRHCYMDAPSARYGELPTADMLRLVDQFEAANVQRVNLTGGEALLRADIWELIAELAGRGITVHQLSTNGLLLDDAALARLRGLGVDPIIHLSFDGVGTHDGMRGVRDVESPALDTIRRTAAAGFRTAVTSSLDAETRAGVLRAFEVLAGAGVHTWHVTTPMPVGRWAGSDTALPPAESAAVCETLLRRWLDGGRPFIITLEGMFTGSPGGDGPAGGADAVAEAVPTPESLDGPARVFTADGPHCPFLLTGTANVMPDGRVMPCPKLIDTPVHDAMPSLCDVSLSEVWEDAALHESLGPTKAEVLERNPECAACPEYGECGAGCWALGWKATGDRLGRDPGACETAKSGYRRRLAAVAAAHTSVANEN
jgi:radical SAM protein with 4Fe4S-binding SPASM domain